MYQYNASLPIMSDIETKLVYTPFGKGTIVAEFIDGTICVRLEHGGGVILLASEIFIPKAKRSLNRIPEATNMVA